MKLFIVVIGGKIKKARKLKGFTQKELASLVNIKQASLSNIESGKHEPLRKTLIALAQVLEDDFGDADLRREIEKAERPPPSKKEIVENMSAREFISLKFGGKDTRRSTAEAEMLAKLLDAEVERIKREGY